jgi:septal ring factor EnvC (AmiA/AmiB activator)
VLAVALAWSLGGSAASAESSDMPPPSTRLKELEGELQKGQAERDKAVEHAAEIAREAEALRAELVAAASSVQEHEETLSDLENRLNDLDADEAAKRKALEQTREQMNGVMAALTRLASRPTEALIGQPTSPTDTVRTAILLREAVPNLRRQSQKLRDDLAGLDAAHKAVVAQKARIAGTVEKLDADHRTLAALYAKKESAHGEADAERRQTEARLAALAGEAADMRDLLAKLDADQKRLRDEQEAIARQAQAQAKVDAEKQGRDDTAKTAAIARPPAPPRSFAQAQGHMSFPARGPVAIHFGQVNDAGLPAKGISIATRPGAQVVTPFDGEVDFAGPFRGYGLLLIIEHGEGYHTLLAGMARIDCQVGQHLIAGEPVGVMVDSEDKPLLYVELRHQGQPINPLPWLTARKSKVVE